eukprot:3049719-Pleurochrysis_carterae.AAC.2
MWRSMGLRARLRVRAKGVARASLSRIVRCKGDSTWEKAMALNPVARSSSAVMCSHSTWTGESSMYQKRP